MYTLTFSLLTESTIDTINLLEENGTVVGQGQVISQFTKANWTCYTLAMESGFQGFVEFQAAGVSVVIFAINPQEFETFPTTGVGTQTTTLTVLQPNGIPIQGAAVYLTSDIAGKAIVAGPEISRANGTVTFQLLAGTYYAWREHPSYTFDNPKKVTV